jgi:hypothetical protein
MLKDRSEYQRQYRLDHKEHLLTLTKAWQKKNQARINERRRFRRANDRIYREKVNAKSRLKVREYLIQLRDEVFSHYSNGQIKCACCGESERAFLTIDHIRPTNNKHDHGTNLYRRLKKENFPLGYQVLCYNCNIAKGQYGHCPHKNNK